MDEQIYLFSEQIKQGLDKILSQIKKKEQEISKLKNEIERLKKIEEEQKKKIEQLSEKEFLSNFGKIKELSSDKKQDFLNEIEELIRAINEISKKFVKTK